MVVFYEILKKNGISHQVMMMILRDNIIILYTKDELFVIKYN